MLDQGYINQIERSGKKVETTPNLAAMSLYRPCLSGEESGQSGTEKRVIHMRSARFCTSVHDFY